MEIDHDAHQVFTETIRALPSQSDASVMQPSEDAVAARLTAPIVTTYIDTEKIMFERFTSSFFFFTFCLIVLNGCAADHVNSVFVSFASV
jgi:hypothetical protein